MGEMSKVVVVVVEGVVAVAAEAVATAYAMSTLAAGARTVVLRSVDERQSLLELSRSDGGRIDDVLRMADDAARHDRLDVVSAGLDLIARRLAPTLFAVALPDAPVVLSIDGVTSGRRERLSRDDEPRAKRGAAVEEIPQRDVDPGALRDQAQGRESARQCGLRGAVTVRHVRSDVVRSREHGAEEHEVRVRVTESGEKVVIAEIDRPCVSKGRGLSPRPRPCDPT